MLREPINTQGMPSMSSPKTGNEKSPLSTIALVAVYVGAIGSVGLTLYTGRKNPSIVLMLLFAVWGLSPFAVLLIANLISRQWTSVTRVAMYSLMIVIPAVSLAAYSGVWTPPGTHTAFVFLVIPFLSLVLISVVIPVAQKFSRKMYKETDSQP